MSNSAKEVECINPPKIPMKPIGPPPPNYLSQNRPTLPRTTMLETDWRAYVTEAERIEVRRKLLEGYRANAASLEDLLKLVAAIDEELLFAYAASSFSYFRNSKEWSIRLRLKRKEMTLANSESETSTTESSDSPPLPSNSERVASLSPTRQPRKKIKRSQSGGNEEK